MSFIETERLFLRTWMVPGDVEDAYRIYGDPEVMRYVPRQPKTLEEMPAFLEALNAISEREAGLGLWPVVEKASRSVIGVCGLVHIPQTTEIEIGWHLRRDVWGRGFASEMAEAVLAYGFTQLGIARIYALIEPMNAGSIAVANRLHMRFDRVYRAYHRDMLRYYKEPT